MKYVASNRINFYFLKNMLIIILIINVFGLLKISNKDGQSNNLLNYFSEIHLIITGPGNKSILSNSFIFEPNEVKIEGELKNCIKICNFENNEKNAILYFNDNINTCENMFYFLKDIKEIDLSKFDFSTVTSMKNMFRDCTYLEKIEFGNINTSSLTNMELVFQGCQYLQSIDLSKFDTNKVKSFQNIFF